VIDSSIFRPSLDGNDGIFGTSLPAKEEEKNKKGGKVHRFYRRYRQYRRNHEKALFNRALQSTVNLTVKEWLTVVTDGGGCFW
jgi:hypothetical protein